LIFFLQLKKPFCFLACFRIHFISVAPVALPFRSFVPLILFNGLLLSLPFIPFPPSFSRTINPFFFKCDSRNDDPHHKKMTVPKKKNKKELESMIWVFFNYAKAVYWIRRLKLNRQISYQMIFFFENVFFVSSYRFIKLLNWNRFFISFYSGFKVWRLVQNDNKVEQ